MPVAHRLWVTLRVPPLDYKIVYYVECDKFTEVKDYNNKLKLYHLSILKNHSVFCDTELYKDVPDTFVMDIKQ